MDGVGRSDPPFQIRCCEFIDRLLLHEQCAECGSRRVWWNDGNHQRRLYDWLCNIPGKRPRRAIRSTISLSFRSGFLDRSLLNVSESAIQPADDLIIVSLSPFSCVHRCCFHFLQTHPQHLGWFHVLFLSDSLIDHGDEET